MIIDLNQILPWLQHYKYWVIFPLAMVEGPIVTVIAGFLGSLKQLDLRWAYLVIVAGDLVGDSVYYALGRFAHGRVPEKFLRFLGITPARLELIKHYFAHHPKKTFALGKLSHGAGGAALLAAGLVRYPFGKFLTYNLVLTAIKSLLLILIGFYFGQAFRHIKTYLDYAATLGILIFIGLYWAFLRYTKSSLE